MKSHTVAGGPFRGMRYHGDAVCGAATPKIMGVYEIELAPVLRKWSAIPFRRVINAGAAEGYYAVGCAMRWPQATVTAFESNPEGRRLLARNVELNGLQARVNVSGRCGQDDLQAAIPDAQPCLIIMDVEGAEGELLNLRNVPGLADSHIIVEIHDFIDERLGDLVLSQLQSTHVVEEVRSRRRAFWDFHEPRSAWRRLLLLPYLKQYADELRPGPMRWFCCTPVTAVRFAHADALQARGNNKTRSTLRAQRKALARKFAPGLLRPFSGMNTSVRLGEIAQTVLSRWPICPQPAKRNANFCYLAVIDRGHWLMLRESLFSLYRSWNSLPNITVVSDGSWAANEFAEVFAWWPAPIATLTHNQISQAALCAGLPELAEYVRRSLYGLKIAAIVTLAFEQPVLFVDADILWFRDPASLLGDPVSWGKPRALRESNCCQHRNMALQHCAQVLEPPFVNSGIVALHGELMARGLLRALLREALNDPQNSSCEQTIVAAAVKLGGELFPEKVSLVEFSDIHRFRSRNVLREGYYSRHYVNWMRHMLYRDAFKLRVGRL